MQFTLYHVVIAALVGLALAATPALARPVDRSADHVRARTFR